MSAGRIRESLRRVPYGHVVTRNELAMMAYGNAGQGARVQVAKELKNMDKDIPWWRVLGTRNDGKLVLQNGREKQQEKMLLKEHPAGVPEILVRDPTQLPPYLAEVFETAVISDRSEHTHTLIYLHGSSPFE